MSDGADTTIVDEVKNNNDKVELSVKVDCAEVLLDSERGNFTTLENEKGEIDCNANDITKNPVEIKAESKNYSLAMMDTMIKKGIEKSKKIVASIKAGVTVNEHITAAQIKLAGIDDDQEIQEILALQAQREAQVKQAKRDEAMAEK